MSEKNLRQLQKKALTTFQKSAVKFTEQLREFQRRTIIFGMNFDNRREELQRKVPRISEQVQELRT